MGCFSAFQLFHQIAVLKSLQRLHDLTKGVHCTADNFDANIRRLAGNDDTASFEHHIEHCCNVDIQFFGNQVQQVFAARSKEADFDAKIEVLKKHFSRPGVVQDFVARNAPENWSQALMFMYDNITLPAQHSAPGPITQNRARTAGVRVTPVQGGSPASIEERMREMGL